MSMSNLVAACDGRLLTKTSPSLPRRKITRGVHQPRKLISLSTNAAEDSADLSLPDATSSLMDFSTGIFHPSAATNLPYPPCDMLQKRCATDPLPLSKRCDRKVTPTKSAQTANSDVVYGTVPSRLFQEALSREKRQQLSASARNKENQKLDSSTKETNRPKSSDLDDDDPMLLEVLGELKVDSPKNKSTHNVTVAVSSEETNCSVSSDVSSYCSKTLDKPVEPIDEDNDLEDILGELRQQNGIQHSFQDPSLNDAARNKSSLSSRDVEKSPRSFSTSAPAHLFSENILDDKISAGISKIGAHLAATDLKPAKLKLDSLTDNSAKNLTDGPVNSIYSDTVNERLIDEALISSLSTTCSDVNENKLDFQVSVSATGDQNARYQTTL